MQVLQKEWDPTFSEHSYGFRPGRSAHQAAAKAHEYVAEGYRWVVDIDLEKSFDQVNRDKLMGRITKQVEGKQVLKLIRGYLKAGVMENGLVSAIDKGTPQGGPLSPLLSNLVLDELDQELKRRGHRLVRYADDCNIYVTGGPDSRGPEQRIDALSERLTLVELIQQDQLIEQDGAQHDQLGTLQAFDWHLTTPQDMHL